LEFYNKAFAHWPKVETFAQELDGMRRNQELSWPVWNWIESYQAMRISLDELIECLAQCIPELSKSEWSQDLPDYFGKAVHVVGEECFNALINNKADLFARIFPTYFFGALSTFEKLQPLTTGWHYAGAIFTAPVLDLIELSGYAMLFAELHQTPSLQQICFGQWDKYLQPSNKRQSLEWLSAVLSYNNNLFAIAPRSIIRSNWELQFNALLRDLPRKPLSHLSSRRGLPFIDARVVIHPSILIRFLGGDSPDGLLPMYNGKDVFVDLYLAKFPEAVGLRFGIRDNLQDAIERFQQYEDEGKAEFVGDDNE
jgi:hypothetical protein